MRCLLHPPNGVAGRMNNSGPQVSSVFPRLPPEDEQTSAHKTKYLR